MKQPSAQQLSQSKLALQVLPYVTREEVFALKGGAAINFFHQPLPRLSVDLDLCYLPIKPREETLRDIEARMLSVVNSFTKDNPNCTSRVRTRSELKTACSIELSSGAESIKIEPNLVLRGNVIPTTTLRSRPELEELGFISQEVRTLAREEVYAGKICAALDRQLPRDLFDVKLMLDDYGVTDKLKDVFLVYLLYQGRPFEEILNPHRLPFTEAGIKNLEGLALKPYSERELSETREQLITKISNSLNDRDKEFLLSILSDKPRFDLAPYPDLERFPGVQWKLLNVKKMDQNKRRQALRKLEDCFEKGREREL